MSNKKNKEFSEVKKVLGHNSGQNEQSTTELLVARSDLTAPFLDTVQRIRKAEPRREELVSLMNAGFTVMKEAYFEMLRRDVGIKFAETQPVVQKPKSTFNYGDKAWYMPEDEQDSLYIVRVLQLQTDGTYTIEVTEKEWKEPNRIIRATRGQLYTDKEADELG